MHCILFRGISVLKVEHKQRHVFQIFICQTGLKCMDHFSFLLKKHALFSFVFLHQIPIKYKEVCVLYFERVDNFFSHIKSLKCTFPFSRIFSVQVTVLLFRPSPAQLFVGSVAEKKTCLCLPLQVS